MGLVVEIEDRRPRKKPFLGGWRNTSTGLLYYNASTQTHAVGKTDGIVQTVELVDVSTGANRDEAIQVHFLPDIRDRLLKPGVFSPAVSPQKKTDLQLDERRIASAVKIQRFYREYRRKVASRRRAKLIRQPGRVTLDDGRPLESLSSRDTDFLILNRTSPRTKKDFELLYNLLDRWRNLEIERADRFLFRTSKLALGSLILAKEVELLRGIDSLKTAVKTRLREYRDRKFLDELSKPILWESSRGGKSINVDTLRVQRAREYRKTYASLSEDLPVPQRLDLLLKVRGTVEMHTCRQADEVIYLIDQEVDLLSCQVDERKLDWLRRRLRLAFLKLARNSLQPELGEDVRKCCRACGRFLPLRSFERSEKNRTFDYCDYCMTLRTSKEPRVLREPYERMLREIRRFEARMGCYDSPIFAMGFESIRRLVNDVWHGKSAISECDEISELKLVRFRRETEWSPWNCLLLTRREASVHYAIGNIEEFYNDDLLRSFRTRNLQGRLYFESISKRREIEVN